MTRAALEHFGRIDVFVSNAALSIVKPIHLDSPEEGDTVKNANVESLLWSARHIIPVMMQQKSGFILISGTWAAIARSAVGWLE